MGDYNMFTNVWLKKGFDRDEVLTYISEQKESHAAAIKSLEAQIEKMQKVQSHLQSSYEQAVKERDALQSEIDNRYRKYEENYEKIGALVYESRLKGDKIMEDAKRQSESVMESARDQADQMVSDARERSDFMETEAKRRITEALMDNRAEFLRIREILDDAVEQVNAVHRKFTLNYPEAQQIMDRTTQYAASQRLTDGRTSTVIGRTDMMVPVHIAEDDDTEARVSVPKEDVVTPEVTLTDAADLHIEEPVVEVDEASPDLDSPAAAHSSRDFLNEIMRGHN
ncbi:MAG: hypothetical protein KBS83_08585 [Lachnospiraceae bacterium]|nr:hypothetical protein [Candidatus Equihabitans merdae]